VRELRPKRSAISRLVIPAVTNLRSGEIGSFIADKILHAPREALPRAIFTGSGWTPGVIPAVNWKRNLWALWLAEFTAILGFSLSFPFLPIFLSKDLRIHGQADIAFWTGIVASVTEFGLAVASPIWGMLADRYGRKPMLLRAMLGAGISVSLMGLSQTAQQLTILRLLQGVASGTVPAATALVTAETPRAQIGWSLGILGSAIALGGALGPALGGLAASLFGLRATFLGSGILFVLATIPVLLMVKESPFTNRLALATQAPSARLGAWSLAPLGVLIGGQLLMQSSYGATQQLVALRVLELDRINASATTGIAFGASGVATALAAVTYSRWIKLRGYRALAAFTALLMGVGTLALGLAASKLSVFASFVLVGFLYGALVPALSTMIGLEAPEGAQARVYGIGNSASAVGFGLGPLIGGFVTAGHGVQIGFQVAASIAIVLAVSLQLFGREPPVSRS
jgi:MFS transporter, DHA1 family, multidrug resistance protein